MRVGLHGLLESSHLLNLVELSAHLHVHLQSLFAFDSEIFLKLAVLLLQVLNFFFQFLNLFVL